MATKPETTFIKAVHKLLPSELHREKMYNPLRGGTPDVWYSGDKADLWTEYKWLKVIPARAVIRMDALLTPLQQKWLEDRHKQGRNVAVILGAPAFAWVFPGLEWMKPLDPQALRHAGLDRKGVAAFITGRTMHSADKMVVQGGSDNRTGI